MNKEALPRELGFAAVQNSLDHTRANFEKNRELSDSLDQIREKCVKEIHELLGSKSEEYFTFREKRKEVARSMQPLFMATPEGRKIRNQFQKMRVAEANEFIKRLSINRKDIKAILTNIEKNLDQLLKKLET